MEITLPPPFPTGLYPSTRSRSAAHITQAEGRDGTFQPQIGTRIKSVCPTLARLCGAALDELQPGEFWGGRTEVQMRENSEGADLAQPRCNF